jgi:hypothetical protein
MRGGSTMSSDDSLKLALEHSRGMFIYHAGQRIASLNYYFVAIAVVLAGFGHVATSSMSIEDRSLFGLFLSIAGVVLTFCFKFLDKRNEQLVHCDEELVKWAEQKLADLTGFERGKITSASDAFTPKVRYSQIVPFIFWTYITLSVAGGIYSIWSWVRCLDR